MRLGGDTIGDSILGGGTKHFFLLILYNFKNIAPPSPYSAVPERPRTGSDVVEEKAKVLYDEGTKNEKCCRGQELLQGKLTKRLTVFTFPTVK